MLYTIYETQRRFLEPYSRFLNNWINILEQNEKYYPQNLPPNYFTNYLKAQSELLYQFTRRYPKPNFNIDKIIINDKEVLVKEQTTLRKSFCDLKHFKKNIKQEPLLIVAPLSGHYATLLKDTTKTMLKNFDVYITDWKNASEIPLEEGDFGFDDYVQYVIDFIEHLKSKHGSCHVMAVCQPTVPTLTAISYLEKIKSSMIPDSLILMGGPIDVRHSPTKVNNYALKHDLEWFNNNVIFTVPPYFQGYGRKVYPGFLQHTGFVAMNFLKHTQAQLNFFNHLVIGAGLDAKKHKEFYEEYNAVMDLPAKYYLETLEKVFMEQQLAKGTIKFNGLTLSISEIKRVKMLTIEGQMDDISGPGQTHAAIELATNLNPNMKESYTAQGVGHYGIFSGKVWREEIAPHIVNFCLGQNKTI